MIRLLSRPTNWFSNCGIPIKATLNDRQRKFLIVLSQFYRYRGDKDTRIEFVVRGLGMFIKNAVHT